MNTYVSSLGVATEPWGGYSVPSNPFLGLQRDVNICIFANISGSKANVTFAMIEQQSLIQGLIFQAPNWQGGTGAR